MNTQRLRAQIAALQDATMDENKNFYSAYDEGKFNALSAVDNLLDSMQEELVCEELENEIKRYLHEVFDRDNTVSDVARYFANWQKEQIMKDAIDAKIGSFVNGTIYDADFNIDSNLKDDEKIKIIIIKSE